jgi:hypothetical protein
MNNQNNYTNYASNSPANPAQNTEYLEKSPYQENGGQYLYNSAYNAYPQTVSQEDGVSKILGILSVIFSSVGLGCCGIQFSLIGLIMGIVAMVQAKKHMQKSNFGLTGVILGAVSIVLYGILMAAYFSLIISSITKLGGSFDNLF